jgi:hypothetical protein
MTRKVNILSASGNLSVNKANKEVNNGFKVWPVPNNGSFSILMENEVDKAELKVFDILGKEVVKRNISSKTQENIHLHTKGVFIIKVSNPDTKEVLHVKKIIVQ